MNERSSSVKLNMLMNTLLTLSSIIFPLITLPYVTRVLGTEGVGKVYFATSVVTFFSILAELGIPVYGIRACAKIRDDRIELSRTVQEIMLINFITCAAVYVVFGVTLCLVPRLASEKSLMIIMSSVIILNALGAEWLYKALEKYTYITVRSVTFKFIALIAMFMVVKSPEDYVIYGALTIFAASASNILNFCNLRKYISLKPTGGYDLSRHIPSMLMLFMLAAATTIYTNLDVAFLGFMKGDAEAGLYGVSVKIKLVIVNLVTSVSAVLLPRTSVYYSKGLHDEFEDLIIRTAGAVNTASVPAACLFVITAPQCIEILAGDSFAGAVLPMRIIVPASVAIGISNIVGIQMLVPMGKEETVVRSACIAAMIDVVLNLILIPRYASAGAAAATLTAEIFVTAYLVRTAVSLSDCKARDFIPDAGILIAAAGGSAAAIVSVLTIQGIFASLAAAGISLFAIYSFILVLIRRKNELLR